MSKRLLACLVGAMALLLAAPALAAEPPPAGVQTADQSATSEQAALAASEATQVKPSNTNIAIRVFSPGDDGSVAQSNDVSSKAEAENDNSTDQDADQSQSGSGGIQTADQSAENAQLAAAKSTAAQWGASNTNLPIRVGSTGSNGSVTQANDVSSKAEAENDNDTDQDVDQSIGSGKDDHGCGCTQGGPAIQTADQSSESAQLAAAKSEAVQKGASNVNLGIRVGSEGDNGDVTQSNSVSSKAEAENDNSTDQDVDQSQGTSGKNDCCSASQAGVQTADQSATNEQAALAKSTAVQEKPKNVNISIRVFSPGDDGSVSQSNTVSSKAEAENDNETEQDVDQTIGSSGKGSKDDGYGRSDCGCSAGTGIQTADQSAFNGQLAAAKSEAVQKDATNVNLPIRVGSEGDNGSVEQSNDVSSKAEAENDNDTEQDIDQTIGSGKGGKDGHGCGCSKDDTAIQTADQSNASLQAAAAFSFAKQEDAKNLNKPIRVLSDGDNGSVEQSNDVSSKAEAENDNDTEQDIDQTIGSGSSKGHDDKREDGRKDACCSSGTAIQTADQSNASAQFAAAASAAIQKDATNVNKPIRVLSDGDNGSVEQSNDVSSKAEAENDNDTEQDIDQTIGSGKGHDGRDDLARDGKSDCGCSDGTGIQVAKQSNLNLQAAAAFSLAKQDDAKNVNAPIRVKSDGDDGSVSQSNDVSSKAEAENDNDTEQDIDQTQSGSGSGLGVQVAYQSALNGQLAAAASGAFQSGASNSNSPIRVLSDGDGGSVDQSNDVSSKAEAENDNDTEQDADQTQKSGHDCKCADGIGIQVVGQKAVNEQAALATSFAVQDFGRSECGCHSGGNSNSPVRVHSSGGDGDVSQSNDVSSKAEAENDNDTDQDADQKQFGGSGIGIQVVGHEAYSAQLALAHSAAAQFGASNHNSPLRVYSSGAGGSVEQSNDVSSKAEAENDNDTEQDADQFQGSHGKRCGCSDGLGIQVIGQSAKNAQAAAALSGAFQLAPKNSNKPVSVWSHSDGGSVEQDNSADSRGEAENDNRLEQLARQFQL